VASTIYHIAIGMVPKWRDGLLLPDLNGFNELLEYPIYVRAIKKMPSTMSGEFFHDR